MQSWYSMKIFILIIIIITNLVSLISEDRSQWTEVNGLFSWPQWKIESGWQDIKFEEQFEEEKVEVIANCNECSFILFTAAWCPDSRIGTPKVIQLLIESKHYPEKFKLIGLDRNKSEPAGNNYVFEIQKVPTLIILKNSKEIGRIVEYPEKSWHDDILKIIEINK